MRKRIRDHMKMDVGLKQNMKAFAKGGKYILVDAGGGTTIALLNIVDDVHQKLGHLYHQEVHGVVVILMINLLNYWKSC